MRRIILLLFLFLAIVAAVTLMPNFKKSSSESESIFPYPSNAAQQSPKNVRQFEIEMDKVMYLVTVQQITAPEKLTLISNFSDYKTSQTLFESNQCQFGANGSFYTPDHQPLGLFVAQRKIFNETVHDQTFLNGFFYKTTEGKLVISKTAPDISTVDFLIQSGPHFTPKISLQIKDDERARRIIVAQTSTGNFYFIVVTEKENTNSGPRLTDLPQIVQKMPLSFSQLINLDGGSASALYTDSGISFSEITPVGSFFCGK